MYSRVIRSYLFSTFVPQLARSEKLNDIFHTKRLFSIAQKPRLAKTTHKLFSFEVIFCERKSLLALRPENRIDTDFEFRLVLFQFQGLILVSFITKADWIVCLERTCNSWGALSSSIVGGSQSQDEDAMTISRNFSKCVGFLKSETYQSFVSTCRVITH